MGIVYVFTNPAMPGYVKIGKTANEDINKRMSDLQTTGVPLPFKCVFAVRVDDMGEIERLAHAAFAKDRVEANREFFEIEPEQAVAVLKISGGEDITPREEINENEEAAAAVVRATQRRSRFNFSMVGLKEGAELTYTRKEGVTATVHSDLKRIVFRGEPMSMTQAVRTLLEEEGINWQTIAGPDYWKYGEEVLPQMRKRIEADEANEEN